MKLLALAPLLLLFLFGGGPRTSLTLAWNPAPGKDIVRYCVYYADMQHKKAAKAKPLDVGAATQATVPNLISGHMYYFTVTAFNSKGRESLPSNLVKCVAGPATPSQTPTPRRRNP